LAKIHIAQRQPRINGLKPINPNKYMNTKSEEITISSIDNCFERAAKILQVAGIKTTRDTVNRMAEAIEKYKEVDTEYTINNFINTINRSYEKRK